MEQTFAEFNLSWPLWSGLDTNMLGRLIMAEIGRDFTEKFNESSWAFLAQRCSNKQGRYVAVAEYE